MVMVTAARTGRLMRSMVAFPLQKIRENGWDFFIPPEKKGPARIWESRPRWETYHRRARKGR